MIKGKKVLQKMMCFGCKKLKIPTSRTWTCIGREQDTDFMLTINVLCYHNIGVITQKF